MLIFGILIRLLPMNSYRNLIPSLNSKQLGKINIPLPEICNENRCQGYLM